MTLLLSNRQRLLMIGDSITDCGRARPVGTLEFGLGDGYVSLVNSLLTATYPELGIEVLNLGIGGNTVRDLNARWKTDVINLRPDILTIMIGTNDVWRQFDTYDPSGAVQPDEFVRTYNMLIETAKPLVQQIVLLTPFYIQKQLTDAMRSRMDDYVKLVKSIGEEHGLPVLDTQAAYDKVLEFLPYTLLAHDRVHPTLTGHVVLAKGILKVLGFEW